MNTITAVKLWLFDIIKALSEITHKSFNKNERNEAEMI